MHTRVVALGALALLVSGLIGWVLILNLTQRPNRSPSPTIPIEQPEEVPQSIFVPNPPADFVPVVESGKKSGFSPEEAELVNRACYFIEASMKRTSNPLGAWVRRVNYAKMNRADQMAGGDRGVRAYWLPESVQVSLAVHEFGSESFYEMCVAIAHELSHAANENRRPRNVLERYGWEIRAGNDAARVARELKETLDSFNDPDPRVEQVLRQMRAQLEHAEAGELLNAAMYSLRRQYVLVHSALTPEKEVLDRYFNQFDPRATEAFAEVMRELNLANSHLRPLGNPNTVRDFLPVLKESLRRVAPQSTTAQDEIKALEKAYVSLLEAHESEQAKKKARRMKR